MPECCTVRNNRSGCGIRMVKRPSAGQSGGSRLASRWDWPGRVVGLPATENAATKPTPAPHPPRPYRGTRLSLPVRHRDRRHDPPCRAGTTMATATTSTRLKAPEPLHRLRTKRGHVGSADRSCRLDNIWQPLQTPSAKLSGRRTRRTVASASIKQNRLGPARRHPARRRRKIRHGYQTALKSARSRPSGR